MRSQRLAAIVDLLTKDAAAETRNLKVGHFLLTERTQAHLPERRGDRNNGRNAALQNTCFPAKSDGFQATARNVPAVFAATHHSMITGE